MEVFIALFVLLVLAANVAATRRMGHGRRWKHSRRTGYYDGRWYR